MSTRFAGLALAVSLLFGSACTPSRAAIASGAGSILLGGLMYGAGSTRGTSCSRGPCDGFDRVVVSPIQDGVNVAEQTIGMGFMVTGAALVVVGLVLNNRDAESERHARNADVVSRSAPPSVVTTASSGAPGAGDARPFDTRSDDASAAGSGLPYAVDAPAPTRLATPAEIALRARVENRLAIQASFTARRGDCVAAVATSARLAEVDPVLHAELLRTDANLVACLERAAAQN